MDWIGLDWICGPPVALQQPTARGLGHLALQLMCGTYVPTVPSHRWPDIQMDVEQRSSWGG